jgi:transposase
VGLEESTPEHSTLSRTRRLLDVETHAEVFGWVLGLLAERGLIVDKRVSIDATTLEANAAMRGIVRCDSGVSYDEFLTDLAKASGFATPTREDLAPWTASATRRARTRSGRARWMRMRASGR